MDSALLCLDIPRLGEMIAFRKSFDRMPPDVAMDEALGGCDP